jgi:hypothetical protein
MAMTSEAAVMSNPVSRGYPFARPPSPMLTWRSAVVHVQCALPGHLQCVDPMRIAVQGRGVEHRGEQIVRCRDCMDVAREVQV